MGRKKCSGGGGWDSIAWNPSFTTTTKKKVIWKAKKEARIRRGKVEISYRTTDLPFVNPYLTYLANVVFFLAF